jgi:hypothetical protein
MPLFKFRNPFRVSGSTGFLVSNTDVIDGLTKQSVALSIGQSVATTDDVVFNDINQPTSVTIGTPAQNIVLSYASISGSITQTYGDSFVVRDNLSALSDMTVTGNITARKIEGERTGSQTLHDSGSSKFGDDVNDTHEVTGSIFISGSYELNSYSVNEISADTTGADESTTALIVEGASKQFFSGVTSQNDFIRQKFAHKGSILSGATASFSAATASAPTGLEDTTKDDFTFFNNGMVIEYDALTVEQSGSKFLLKVNPNSLGYGLSSNDEIVAWGKFDNQNYLDFDGLTNEITTDFSGSSVTPLHKTYSFWMKSTHTARNYAVFAYGSQKKGAFTTNFSSGRPIMWNGNSWYTYWEDTSAQDDGEWHHWLVYNDVETIVDSKLYVDGVLIEVNSFVTSGTVSNLNNQTQPLTIMSYQNNSTNTGRHFEGSIREFAVFSGDKTSKASIYYNSGTPYDMTDEDDLQGYWKMNEGSGTTVADTSGGGNDGTVDGATWDYVY